MLIKASQAGKVPVKLSVTRKGKTFMQTFWIKKNVAGVLNKLAGFFGTSKSKAKDVPKDEFNKYKSSVGIDYPTWESHFTEYFKNKVKWDAKFKPTTKIKDTKTGTTYKVKTPKEKKEPKEPSKPSGSKFDVNLMRFLSGQYRGGAKKKVAEKPVPETTPVEQEQESDFSRFEDVIKENSYDLDKSYAALSKITDVPIEISNAFRALYGKDDESPKESLQNFINSIKPEPKLATKAEKKQNTVHSPNFEKWFGDSKVLNKAGDPAENYPVEKTKNPNGKAVVVYHGTSTGGWNSFDKDKIGEYNLYGKGFYFTEDKGVAEEYSTKTNHDYKLDEEHIKKLKPIGGKANIQEIHNKVFQQYEDKFGVMEAIDKMSTPEFKAIVDKEVKGADKIREEFFNKYLETRISNLKTQFKKQYQKDLGKKKKAFIDTGSVAGLVSETTKSYIPGKIETTIHKSDVENIVPFQKDYGIDVMPGREIKEVYLKIENPIDLDVAITDDLIDKLYEQTSKGVEAEMNTYDWFREMSPKEKKERLDSEKSAGSFYFKHIWDDPKFEKKAVKHFQKLGQIPANVDSMWDADIAPTKENVKHIMKLLTKSGSNNIPTDNGKPTGQHLMWVLSDSNWSSRGKETLTDAFKAMGHDGMSHTGGWNVGTKEHKVWIAFEPTQIKSTEAKEFDPNDSNLLKAKIHLRDGLLVMTKAKTYQVGEISAQTGKKKVGPGKWENVKGDKKGKEKPEGKQPKGKPDSKDKGKKDDQASRTSNLKDALKTAMRSLTDSFTDYFSGQSGASEIAHGAKQTGEQLKKKKTDNTTKDDK